jgi:hypothetical protein
MECVLCGGTAESLRIRISYLVSPLAWNPISWLSFGGRRRDFVSWCPSYWHSGEQYRLRSPLGLRPLAAGVSGSHTGRT